MPYNRSVDPTTTDYCEKIYRYHETEANEMPIISDVQDEKYRTEFYDLPAADVLVLLTYIK